MKRKIDLGMVAAYMIIALFLGFIVLTADSCAPVKGLTQQQTNLLRFYSIFNSQYDDYQRQTADPSSLSEERKVVLRQKRIMLIELHRLIRIYELAVNAGNIDHTTELEQKIFDLIDRLGG